MARIYDNIDVKFEQGLKNIIDSPNVKRVDFCVGYFNLRGWKLIVDQVNNLPGDYVDENCDNVFRICRLLIGMHRPNEEYIRMLYGKGDVLPDANMVQRCKLQIAIDFRRQLLLGLPTKQDEWTLRRLSAQLKEGKVVVKLYLREPLHAKLYIAHKDDYSCPRVCVMGSSNLTYSGLTRQGELNAEFANEDETNKFYNWFEGGYRRLSLRSMSDKYPSSLLEKAVSEFSKLPGIGRKSALRLVLYMLRRENEEVDAFSEAITTLKHEVKYCKVCHNISDTDVCPICSDVRRDATTICVVENIQDVMAIEKTQQYNGLYHVLGGIISPMDGIGPNDIEISSLVERVKTGKIKEVILALSSTMEGDTTNFFISRKLADFDVAISVIARGISVGDELEYTDEVTLGRSIINRTPFKQ